MSHITSIFSERKRKLWLSVFLMLWTMLLWLQMRILSGMQMVIIGERKRKFLWTGSVKKRIRVPSEKCQTIYQLLKVDGQLLPVEIWSKIISFLELIDIFSFSNVSKFYLDVSQSLERFVERKPTFQYLVSYDYNIFDFFEKELIDLDKTIEKTLKNIMNKDNQTIFDIINVMIKQTCIQTFFIWNFWRYIPLCSRN